MTAPESLQLPSDTGPFAGFLGDLDALGVRLVSSGGSEYMVIRARTNARWWLLPLGDRRTTAAGLEMLQPVSWRAAFAKAATRLMVHTSPRGALGRQRVRLSGKPDLAGAFACDAQAFAYFTGTDGPHRKTTVQVMNRRGGILGYAKISRLPRVTRFIAAEAQMLTQLETLGLRTVDVPRVMAFDRGEARTLLVTDSIKTAHHSAPKRLGATHHAFFDELAARTGRTGAGETLARLDGDAKRLRAEVGADWRARFGAGIEMLRGKADRIPVGLAHGDFTPWNTFLLSGRLYVFDWEYAGHAHPLGYDHLHFLLATATNKAPHFLANRIVADLAEARYDGSRELARYATLFALLLHAAFYLGRSVEAGDAQAGFENEEQRAALIDALVGGEATP